MAIPATVTWEIQSGGSDTANGGSFDTASTGKPTDLTCTTGTGNTSTPEVSSASYNFVAGDVGHWLFVQGGTNWTPGWYVITAVASNKATVNAAIGAAVLSNGTLSTVAGVATTGTPTGGTWAVDYSQVASVPFSLTGITTAAANAILLTASATKAMVGNGIVITGGTNFTTGYYTVIAATAGTSLTVDRNATTAAGSAGTAGLGGALASPGKAGGLAVSGNDGWLKAATYSITSTTNNISAGKLGLPNASNQDEAVWSGYSTTRGDGGQATILAAGAVTSIALVTGAIGSRLQYCILDGASKSGLSGYSGGQAVFFCKAQHCPSGGFNNATLMYACEATDCNGTNGGMSMSAGVILACTSHDNAGPGFLATGNVTIVRSLAWGNTGSNGRGFNITNTGGYFWNCLAYGNAQAGFYSSAGINARGIGWWNCLSVGNTTYGFAASTTTVGISLFACAGYNNPSGDVQAGAFAENHGFITLTADPFVAAGSQNFALNTTSGGGAALRAASLPATWPGASASMISYTDLGAVQHADPAATVLGNWIGLV